MVTRTGYDVRRDSYSLSVHEGDRYVALLIDPFYLSVGVFRKAWVAGTRTLIADFLGKQSFWGARDGT